VPSVEPITFATHVQDVVDLLTFEDLRDVILVGWSYGGAVADGVADVVPERLRDVVNLDGEILREGHSLLDGWTEEARAHYATTLETARTTGWMPAPTDLESIRDPELTHWVLQRVRPHPVGTYTEVYPDTGSRRHEVPHTYLRCGTLHGEEPIVTELRGDPHWRFRELPTLNHLALFLAPDHIADALQGLASRSG
jgi:pimeloyl-ACP methyl ester carboxylesterase